MAKATLTFGMDLSEFNTAFNKINRQTSDLSQSLGRGIGDAMSAYKKGLSQLKLSTSLVDKEKIKSDLDSLRNKIKTSTKAKLDLDISEAKNKLKGLVGGILAAIGAVKGMTAPISAAIGFEEAMADVKKVVDFDSKDDLKAFSDEVLKLSRTIPLSANELAKITSDGGRLGIAKKNLIGFTELVAKMGTAFEVSSDEAGKSIAGLMNIYKLDLSGVERLGDAMNYLDNTMNTTVPKIMQALTDVGATGKLLNFDAIATTNLAGTLTSLNIDAGTASTSMRKFFSVLSSIENGTKPARKAFETLGIDIKSFQKMVKKDGEQAFLMVFEKIAKLDQFKQSSILKNLFGTEHLGTASSLINALDIYKETIKKTSNEQNYLGGVQKEYQARNETTANSIQILKNNFNEIAVKIGRVFLPTINQITGAISKFATKIADFSAKFPKLIKYLGFAVGGVATLSISFLFLKVVSSAATIGISYFSGLLLKLPTVLFNARVGIMAFSSALKAVNLAFATNPIGAILTAIAVAGLLVYRYWDELKAFFSGFFIGLKTGLEPTITAFKNAFGGIFGALKSAKDILVSFFSLFSRGEKAKDKLNGIKEVGIDFGVGFGKSLSLILYPLEALSNIFNAIGLIVDIIALKGANFTEGFTNGIKNMCENIKAFFKPLFDFIMAGFDKALSILLYPLEALSNIFNALGLAFDIFMLKGRNFTEGFSNGVKGMCENIKAFFKPLFDFIMSGFDSIRSVYDSIVNLPSNLTSGAKGLWSGAKEFFGFGGDEQNTKGAIKEVVASNQNYIDNKSTRQITDNKVINISMQGSNATPESVATAIRNNSYAFGGD